MKKLFMLVGLAVISYAVFFGIFLAFSVANTPGETEITPMFVTEANLEAADNEPDVIQETDDESNAMLPDLLQGNYGDNTPVITYYSSDDYSGDSGGGGSGGGGSGDGDSGDDTSDTTPPIITIHSPENITYFNPIIDLNWSADETLSWATYLLNGGANTSLIYRNTSYSSQTLDLVESEKQCMDLSILESLDFYEAAMDLMNSSAGLSSGLEIDIGNDTLVDMIISGDIDSEGNVNIFSDNTTSKTIVSTSAELKSETFYITLPKGVTITSAGVSINTGAYEDVVLESFCDTSNIDMDTTNATVNTWMCQLENPVIGGFPYEGWYYSGVLANPAADFTSLTLTAEYDEDANASANFWMSPDNGLTWESATPGVEHAFTAQGNELKIRVQLTSDQTDRANVQQITISGLGHYPEAITLDWDNDGDVDWSYSGEYKSGLNEISIRGSEITKYLASCSAPTCDLPLNFSFTGPGTVIVQSPNVIYSLDDILLPSSAFEAYIGNNALNRTNVTVFSDSADSKSLQLANSETAYIELFRESAINYLQLNITGDWWK